MDSHSAVIWGSGGRKVCFYIKKKLIYLKQKMLSGTTIESGLVKAKE